MDGTDADPRGDAQRIDARLLRIAGVCVLGSMMAIVDTTVVTVAQRTFVATFHSTQAIVAWTMTGYTLALAAVIPLAGWAADRFGTKRPFIGSLLSFTFGSLLCAMAPNIAVLIAFRVVQGLGGGMLMPLVLTILTREAGPQRLGRVLAILGVPMLLGPVFGPVLGGWLIDSFSWQWIFWINVPIGLTTVVLAAIVLPHDEPTPSETFDVVGMLLLSPGLAAFLYGVSALPGRGTVADHHVWIPATAGLALIIAFVLHALYRADHPLIDLRLFENRTVTLANAAMFLFATSFFGAGLLFPSFFQELLHQRPLQAGMSLVPRGIGAMVTMPIAGALMDKRGVGRVLMVGVTLIALGMGVFAFGVALRADYLPTLVIGLAIMGLGMGATMMPLSAVAVQTLAPHQIARGSTLVNVNQQVAASIGTALMSVILTSQFNRSANIPIARQIDGLREEAARRGVPIDPLTLPAPARAPDFPINLMDDLSHAYTVVFVVAVALVALTFVPIAFLPTTPAAHDARQPN
ncbi:High-copy suppressor of rspA [Mycobacterium basiliense]|uniref:High-copy suppressor of rspA n=1 Tax=Mycobacterium basiliense TaxID=2094119 RepID=A0A3S4CBN1_9MYCO|nr:DHA2 family efflux MFS transporter permease subunit [Mycobacterium basiliense]VDM88777.1 High-copy suppressor of rspA [Mycobacterium basiliense]